MVGHCYNNYEDYTNYNIKTTIGIEKSAKYLYTETLGNKTILYDVYLFKQKIIRVKDFSDDKIKIYCVDVKKFISLANTEKQEEI